MTVNSCAKVMVRHGHVPPLASSLIRDPPMMSGCKRNRMVDARICLHVGGRAKAATGMVLELQLITGSGEAHSFDFLQENCKKELDVPFCGVK